jgi:hypothetical protein
MGYTLEALAVLGKMIGALPATARTSAPMTKRLGYLLKNKALGLRRNGLRFVKHEVTTAWEIQKQLRQASPE